MGTCVYSNGSGQWRGDLAGDFRADPAPQHTLTAGWRLDGEHMHVWADRLGVMALYIGARDGVLAISDSAVAAARAVGSAPDADALALFLRIGFLVEEDTLFANVRALKPGETLDIGPDGTVISNSGHVPEYTTHAGIGRDAIVDAYIDMTDRAIRERLPAPDVRYGVPLSGGRDSRHILLGSHAAGRAPDFVATHYAMPPQRDEDMRIAGEIAAALNIDHRKSAIDFSTFYTDSARKNAALDFHTDEHHWFMPLAENLAPQLDFLMDGLAGDALINNLFQRAGMVEALRAGDHDRAAAAVMGPEKSIVWLSPSLQKMFSYDRARARLAEALKPLADRPDPAKEVQVWFRMRREIALAPLKIYPQHIAQVSLPFLDADLVAFARGLTWEEHGAPGIHDAVIHKAFPDFAHIGFEKKGAGSTFSRADSAAMLADFSSIRRDWGKGDLADNWYVSSRLMRAKLGKSVLGSFWWMVWWVHMRGLERALESVGTDFAASTHRAHLPMQADTPDVPFAEAS